ncbi:MAG: formylglycine-generating enzyme family protein [Acidobacteriota bacterium]
MTDRIPELVRIPAGPFLMGGGEGDADARERPTHMVTIDEFLIGACPVTQGEYARFVQATDRRAPAIWELPAIAPFAPDNRFRELAAPYCWSGSEPPAGKDDHPVVLVTYEDASEYCRWLKHETGRGFRLPTEAESEKAARGGLDGKRYPWGDDIDPSDAAYLLDQPIGASPGTRATRSFPPNGYGVFDAAGNVWTWVADWYRPDYYTVSDSANPRGPGSGSQRLLRGGAWTCADPRMLRCANRHPVPPDTYGYSVGFRVASAPLP